MGKAHLAPTKLLKNMEGLEEAIRNTELPAIYQPLHHNCIAKLGALQYQKRIDWLRPLVEEKPSMYLDADADDPDHILRATQLLRQGRRFIELGLQSEDEIKPLLLFYGLTQVTGCLVTSLVKYQLSGGHGIKIDRDLNVRIDERGSFVRYLDMSALIGLRSRYQRFTLDETNSCFTKSSTSLYAKYTKPQPLNTIYSDFQEIMQMQPSAERNVSTDHGAYLLLFIASFLARYRPEIWKRIVDGLNQETAMVIYRRVMESLSDLCQRQAVTVFLTALGLPPNDVLERPNFHEVVEFYAWQVGLIPEIRKLQQARTEQH